MRFPSGGVFCGTIRPLWRIFLTGYRRRCISSIRLGSGWYRLRCGEACVRRHWRRKMKNHGSKWNCETGADGADRRNAEGEQETSGCDDPEVLLASRSRPPGSFFDQRCRLLRASSRERIEGKCQLIAGSKAVCGMLGPAAAHEAVEHLWTRRVAARRR